MARTVGVEGKLGAQAEVPGVAGTWKDLTDNVNLLANNLTAQVRNIAEVTTAVANGDLSQKITVDAKGEVLELKNTINTMVDQLRSFAARSRASRARSARKASWAAQADVPGVAGTWKDLTDNVNVLAGNLTDQVRNIAKVTIAVANGDLSQKITVGAKGEIAQLKDTINIMVDQLRSFAAEVTRVAKEVGTEGKLGGQAEVQGVSGMWKDLTDNVNVLAGQPDRPGAQHRQGRRPRSPAATCRRRSPSTCAARSSSSRRPSTPWSISCARSPPRSRASRSEVGTEGKLGGQAEVRGVSRRLEGPDRQRQLDGGEPDRRRCATSRS